VNVCFPRDETNIVANSAAAFAVVGINKITLSGPDRASATTVLVALAVKVTDPVLFNFPSIVLFTTSAICLGSAPIGGSVRN
jgi:hypothetical protein